MRRDETGEHQNAICDYNEAIRLKPEFAAAYFDRGVAYRRERQIDKAIIDYSEAIRLMPGFAKVYGNRGVAFRRER